ncbi:hypothetical protein [Flavobacterium sp.]|uniref:hypothetical protein n=1 Tax=Flavobacterium sp. TaxID=239 RepID=UPI00262A33DF|nr:hypothetical protein [Flavobacterium sp.]
MDNKQTNLTPERIEYYNGVLSALLTVASHGQGELYKTIVQNAGSDELVWVATNTKVGFDLDRHYLAKHGFMPASFICESEE